MYMLIKLFQNISQLFPLLALTPFFGLYKLPVLSLAETSFEHLRADAKVATMDEGSNG
jgi:hypothetical protein